jgi:hypothetical protein
MYVAAEHNDEHSSMGMNVIEKKVHGENGEV